MLELSTMERDAIEAVAKRRRGVWNRGTNRADAVLTVAGRRLAVDVIATRPKTSGRPNAADPRLRFDKGALRLVNQLRAALSRSVRRGTTLIVTITAPIRLTSKTAAVLEAEGRALLATPTGRKALARTIHGNRIRIGIVKGGTSGTSKVVGFVHNADSDPEILFAVTRILLARIGPEARARARGAYGRWLVIANQNGLTPVGAYRHVCSQLRARGVFDRMDAVMPGGRVEPLGD